MSENPQKSKIQCKNSQDDTVFTLTGDHSLTKHVTEVEQANKKAKAVTKGASSESFTGGMGRGGKLGGRKKQPQNKEGVPESPTKGLASDLEVEVVGNWQDPHVKYFQYPRLFVINNDGSARELMSEPQLEYATRLKKVQADQSIKQKMADVVNNSSLANHYYLTKVINMKQREIEQ